MCPSVHAASGSAGDVGLGELEKAGLHDRMLALPGQTGGQRAQVFVGGLMAAAVGD
jgi:hypothetical protein